MTQVPEKFIYDEYGFCKKIAVRDVIISFSKVDAIFDNSQLYFVKNGKRIQGAEIVDTAIEDPAQKIYGTTLYNLADPEIIKKKQNFWLKSRDFATFKFRFTMSCQDLEDAILVIDGLKYHGMNIPALKVRLNYYDFAKVPEYVWPASTSSQPTSD